jgi:hypothetical protein
MSSSALPSRDSATRPQPADLDPELRQILGPPPLYQGESEADYNQLYDHVRKAVLPKDVIEEIWVRDVVDLTWEANRLRRLKANLMDAASSQGLAVVLENLGDYKHDAERKASAYARGDSKTKTEVDQVLETAKVGRGIVEAQAFTSRINDFDRIDRLIMLSESRRNAALRETDRHREAMARRAREALTEIEDAEFEEVSPPNGQASK